jgi:RNA polymerase sigma-70 factor (ECF subfamily)
MSEALDQHIQACLDGDMDRFTEVVTLCEPRVRAVLAAMSPDPNVVPDLTQEVFLIAYQRLDSYQPGSNFLAWIRTIARHVAQNARRSWYRRQAMREQYQPEAERLMAENIDRLVESLPEETLEALRACVGGLGGRNKELVDGYYFEGNSLKRIAEFLNMSPSAAKVALHRARQAIGICLHRKGAS